MSISLVHILLYWMYFNQTMEIHIFKEHPQREGEPNWSTGEGSLKVLTNLKPSNSNMNLTDCCILCEFKLNYKNYLASVSKNLNPILFRWQPMEVILDFLWEYKDTKWVWTRVLSVFDQHDTRHQGDSMCEVSTLDWHQ